MHANRAVLVSRQQSCPAGTTFFLCGINDFQGCCSVDPCGLDDGCPDAAPPPNANSRILTTLTATDMPSATAAPPAEPTSTLDSPSSALPTVTPGGGANEAGGVDQSAGGEQQGSSGAQENSAGDGDAEMALSTGAMAGIAVAIIALLVGISVLAFLYVRRGKRLKKSMEEANHVKAAESSDKFGDGTSTGSSDGSPTAAKLMNEGEDPFAGHDGRYRSSSVTESVIPQRMASVASSNQDTVVASPISRTAPSILDGATSSKGTSSDGPPRLRVETTLTSPIAELDGTCTPRRAELPSPLQLGQSAPTSDDVERAKQRYQKSHGGPLTPVRETDWPEPLQIGVALGGNEFPRATLNCTEEERKNCQYVTSFNQYPGK